ncbi:MAG: hypothetical protein MUO31_00870 [Thermodesulfovibrionales bacterium]|nr:hypothetical protein [Thermodesulfovibrionales bacterium]
MNEEPKCEKCVYKSMCGMYNLHGNLYAKYCIRYSDELVSLEDIMQNPKAFKFGGD